MNIEILIIRDLRVNSYEYHGLVRLDSDKVAKHAVVSLKDHRLRGRHVVVRPYFERSEVNDPRRISQHHQAGNHDADFVEKRQGDRRRGKFLEVTRNRKTYVKADNEDPLNQVVQLQATFIVPSEIETAVAECMVEFEIEKSADASSDHADSYRLTRYLTEWEGPANTSRRFQIYVARPVLTELLARLKREFPGKEIHYWVAPIIESGVI
ncbi:MAG: DUF3240 family protein [Gammaproteobacteria bacterium]